MSPDTILALQMIILAAITAIVAVIHQRYVTDKAGQEAGEAFDAQQRKLDSLYGKDRAHRSFSRYSR